MSHELTPSEDLMMDALAGRYRLGETLWPFRNDQRAIANRLEAKGLVRITHGMTECHFRAGLTDAGVEKAVDPTYTPPALRSRPAGVSAEYRITVERIEESQ